MRHFNAEELREDQSLVLVVPDNHGHFVEVSPLHHLQRVGRQERGAGVAVHHRLEDERIRLKNVVVEILVQEAFGISNL